MLIDFKKGAFIAFVNTLVSLLFLALFFIIPNLLVSMWASNIWSSVLVVLFLVYVYYRYTSVQPTFLSGLYYAAMVFCFGFIVGFVIGFFEAASGQYAPEGFGMQGWNYVAYLFVNTVLPFILCSVAGWYLGRSKIKTLEKIA